MTLPLVIAPNDPGHIDDHQEIHTLLGRLDGQTDFLAAGSATGALGSRPAASASNLGDFYFAASVPSLAFSDGAQWREQALPSAANTWTAIQNFQEDTFFGSGRPWADVRSNAFAGGAAGDATADDRAAFEAARSEVQNLGGGIVFIPQGVYRIVASGGSGFSQTSTSPLWVMGAGPDASQINFEGDGDAFVLTGLARAKVSDLRINGSALATDQSGIVATNCATLRVERVIFGGLRNHAIHVTGASSLHNRIDQCRITGATSSRVAGSNAIRVDGGTSTTLIDNYLSTYDTLLYTSADGVQALGNNIFEVATTGVSIQGGTFASFGNWWDMSSLTTAVVVGGNYDTGIWLPRGIANSTQINTSAVTAASLARRVHILLHARGAPWLTLNNGAVTTGAQVSRILTATTSLGFPTVNAQSSQSLTMTVTGAQVGDSVMAQSQTGIEGGLVLAEAYVSATNTVTVRLANYTGSNITPAARTWRATVIGYL